MNVTGMMKGCRSSQIKYAQIQTFYIFTLKIFRKILKIYLN